MRILVGNLLHASGNPGKIGIPQTQLRHLIFHMGVESCRYQQQLRLKAVQGRQPVILYLLTELLSAAAGRESDIDNMI